ncbi:MAG: hypothetical protein U9N02_03385 [Campylobacterota bacterium]|nr:hypothetical protein [Campylobacterota bacterium]
MRKIGFAKYKNTTKEILPKTYKIDEIICQRKMFCTMINQYLSDKSQIDLRNELTFKSTLLEIFEEKTLSFFQFYKFKPEKSQKIVKIFTHESLLINQYFKQSRNNKMRFLSKNIKFKQNFKLLYGYAHSATDLIQLIFNGKDIEMMLDLNEVFTNTIFNRIKKEVDKEVTLNSPYIHITKNGVKTRLHPKWKKIDPQSIQSRKSDIDNGFSSLENESIDQCYLIYPKTDNFKKHITLKNESSKELKMVPYSFTFINRGEKRCQK